ncbi:MAG: hypothetical protein H0X02_13715 [Nitrosomonas sp.]|nr:hypothetical protein [Nitrosomonas sp.]
MDQFPSTITLNSAYEISLIYHNIDGCLGHQACDIIVQWNEPHYDDVSGRLSLFRSDIQRCFELVVRSKVRRITFIRVDFAGEIYNDAFKSSCLEKINFIDCRLEFDAIRRAVRDCPRLESVECHDTATINIDAEFLYDDYLGKMIAIVRGNYRLTRLEYSNFRDKVLPGTGTTRFWPKDEITNRKKVIAEYSMLQSFISRNLKGREACRSAIRQICLIKRHRPKSVFRYVNHDILRLICRLLYDSSGTAIWC